ncbi:MAG: phosphatidylserine/phosphatidylglycerophosphate/cardiolipin synthase family protein [Sphingobium sp.]
MARCAECRHERAMATDQRPECADRPEPIERVLVGNRLAVIESGPDLLAALLGLIDGASHSLKLYYYIFAADHSGTLVRDRLIAACDRGVAVTLMIDAFGSATTPLPFFDPLIAAGGHFGRFGARRSTRYLIRNHQKMTIADDQRLLIGGFNVEDDYFGLPEQDCWADLGLLIAGPEVAAMAGWYGQLWRWVSTRKQRLRTLRAMIRNWHPSMRRDPADPFHWLIGGPTRRLSPWAQELKRDLERAGRLDMIEAYFSPGRGMLKRLARAARRGGARLILPSRSDNGATIAAARLLYGPLLKRGVNIFEYAPCRLHMKLIVIDDITYIGSANFDMRSLFINLELMLRIDDAQVAAALRRLIDRRALDSRRITPENYLERRGLLELAKQWVSYFLVGVLDYTVTRRLNFRLPDPD